METQTQFNLNELKKINREKYYQKKLSLKVAQDKLVRSWNRKKIEKCMAELQMFGIGDTLSAASSLYMGYKVGKTMDSVKDQSTQMLNELRSNVALLSDSLMAAIDTLKISYVNKMNTTIDCFQFIKDLLVGCVNVFMAKPEYMLYSIIVNFTGVVARYINVNPMDLCKQFYQYFLDLIGYKEQGPEIQFLPESVEKILVDNNSNVCKLFFFAVVTLFYVIILGRCPGKTDVESMINRMGNLARATFSMKQMYQTIDPIVKEAQEFVKETLNIKTPTELEKILDGYAKWEIEVEELIERHEQLTANDRILRDKDFVLKVEKLYRQGMEFSRELSTMKVHRDLSFSFLTHQKLLVELYKQIDTTGVFGDKPRTRPIVIWLYGESQIGKSGMTWPLAIDLNSELIVDGEDAKDFSKHVYFRNVEQEFWDNYKQQNIVVYDDFGQTKDLEGSPNAEFMEIIRSANIAPYPLHMAHLEDKRKTKFTSKVLMLTSNKKELKVNSLTFPDAVLARINLCGRVHLKPEYQAEGFSMTTKQKVSRLDKDKARAEAGAPLNTNVYLIDIVDAESDVVLESNLTYDQFKEKAVAILHKELNASMELTQFLSAYAEKSFQNRRVAEVQIDPEDDREQVLQQQYQIIDVEQEESSEFDELTQELFDSCRKDTYRKVHLCAIDLQNNVYKAVLEFNPLVFSLDFFRNMVHFEFSQLKKEGNITRLGFYKKCLKNRWTEMRKNTKGLVQNTIDTIKKMWSLSPFGTACMLTSLVAPLVVLVAKCWPSTFKYKRVKKHIITVNRTVKLPHIITVTDFDDLLSQITTSRVSVVAMASSMQWPDGALDYLDDLLDNLDFYVLVIMDVANKPISVADNTTLVLEIKRILTSAIADGKPCPATITCDMEGNLMVNNPFAKPLDIELGQSGDLVTRKAAHQAYLEMFKETKVRNLKNNDKLVREIVEIAQSGDSITRKTPTNTYVELAQSGDSITAKKISKTYLELAQSGDVTTQKKQNLLHMELAQSGDAITKKARYQQILESYGGEIQIQEDINAHQLINYKILKNMYACEMYDYSNGQDRCVGKINILFVRGRLAITPGHIKYALDKCNKIVLVNCFGVRYEMLKENVTMKPMYNCLGEQLECCMLEFYTYVQSHSDIVNHFTDAKSMALYTNMRTLLPSLRQQKDQYLPYIYVGLEAEAQDVPISITDSNDSSLTCLVRKGMQYRAATQRGDCGAPLIVDNKMITKKIVGLHVVGKLGNRCLAETVTQKDLLRAFESFSKTAQIQFHDEMLPGYTLPDVVLKEEEIIPKEEILKLVPCERFLPISECDCAPFTANKSDIHPSLVHGKIEPLTTKPAHLRPIEKDGKIFDIKQEMLRKAAMDTPYIPKYLIDEAYCGVKSKLLADIQPKFQRILTLEESVEGIPGEEYLGPINRITSPGFPWVNSRTQGKGKQQWLGDDEKYIISQDLRDAVEERLRFAKKGIRMPCVWTDTLKDERRPIAKVDAGKTRVFAAGPQDFTLLYRQYFLGFVAHIMENRIYNEQSLGTNVYSEEWGMSARYLQQVGKKVIAGDFQTFDGTLNTTILDRFVDLANEFYNDGEENALVRQVLFKEIVNSIHLFPEWKMFYMWTHSQTSGSPTTTPVNSFYNSMGMRICFLLCAKKANVKVSIYDFDKYVRMLSYGDDDVVNISDDIIDWFNQETITEAFSLIGMIYTDEAKTGEASPKYRLIHEVSYLKRKFIYDENTKTWLAPLDLGVCLEMPNWIRGKIDPLEATRQNCETAINELAWHDRQTFEKYSRKIEQVFRQETGKCLNIQSYDGYHYKRMMDYFISDESTTPLVTRLSYNLGENDNKALVSNKDNYLVEGFLGSSPTQILSKPQSVMLGCIDNCDFMLQ